MPRPDGFSSTRHAVFKLVVHMVFVPKYRRRVITERVFEVLRAAWIEVCTEYDAEILETNCEPDHVHLLLAYPPKVRLSELAGRLKAISSRRVRERGFPEVTRVLRGSHFWSASYFAASCGGAPIETLRRYVESQAGAAADPSAGPLPPRPSAAAAGRGLRGSKPEREIR
jgi:putative transposase